jgi:predicted outer membrane repeat protein
MLLRYFHALRARFTDHARRSRQGALGLPRRLNFEQLEDRRVLSATFNPDGANFLNDAAFAKIDNDLALISLGFTSIGETVDDIVSESGISIDDSMWQWKEDAIGISALATSDPAILAEDLAALGMEAFTISRQIVSGFLPTTSIGALASLESLKFAHPALKPISYVGLVTSGGDAAQRSTVVRSFLEDPVGNDDLVGTGVRVGVISDSYDNEGDGSAAADIATGDLPGTGNPNGFTIPVTIVRDNVAGTDEGRAMLQIVHDVAPGAQLLFSNVANEIGMETSEAFAANIRRMRNDFGANIIVDDIVFVDEPFFMDGLVSQAINDVVADGVTYFSAAGNQAMDSYESLFVSSGVTENFTVNGVTRSELLHDFDPGAGVDTRQRISIPAGRTDIIFQWDDPSIIHAPMSGGAVRDFDIYVLRTDGSTIRGGVSSTIGGNAVETTFVNFASAGVIDVVVGLRNGVNPGGFLKYIVASNGAAADITEYAVPSATTFGHVNATGAIGVGAAFYQDTPEFGASPAVLEGFSSAGGVSILFDTDGNRLPEPQVRNAVDVVAPDGVNTTFFGQADPVGTGNFEADGFPNFFGTSAAAPHVAGLAALLLQENPLLTPKAVLAALADSTIDMDNPFTAGFDEGFDAATGYGFVDALGAIGIVQDTPQLLHLDPDDYILVNDTRDLLDANSDPDIIDVDLGMVGNQVSLRAAVIAAHAGGTNATTLLVRPGVYNLDRNNGTESVNNNDLDVTNVVTIVGAAAGLAVVNADGLTTGAHSRIFQVSGSSAVLDLARLTLTGATSSATGGAILIQNDGAAILDRVALVDNATTGTSVGGAIRAAGAGTTLDVRDSVFTNNTAYWGGAIYADNSAQVTIGGTLFADNEAYGAPPAGNYPNVYIEDGTFAPAAVFVNEGYNLVDENFGGFFTASFGDQIGTPGGVDYVVTSIADRIEADDSYALSLREAVMAANAVGGVIWLPAWRHRLTRTGTENASNNDLDVTSGEVEIVGAGPGLTVIDASGLGSDDDDASDRIFHVTGSSTVLDISGVTLTGGKVPNEGAAMLVQTGATANLRRVAVVGNTVTEAGMEGAGVRIGTAHVSIHDSVFTENSADYGGAIYSSGTSTLTIGSTVFAKNSAAEESPNIFVENTSTTVVNEGNNVVDGTADHLFEFSANFADYIDDTVAGESLMVVTGVADRIDSIDDSYVLSIREAVLAANEAEDPITIWLPAWRHRLTLADASESSSTNDLDITSDVTIVGTGPGLTVIDAAGLQLDGTGAHDRIFQVSGSLDLSGVTLTGAINNDRGGAVYVISNAAADFRRVAFVGNESMGPSPYGGGLFAASANVSIRDSLFTDNTADYGGAIYANGTGTLTIGSTVFAKNNGSSPGPASVYVENSTVALVNEGYNVSDENPTSGFFEFSAAAHDHIDTTTTAANLYVVTTVVDAADANLSDSVPLTASGYTSLRAAIQEANDEANAQTIWLPAWRLRLSVPDGQGGVLGLDLTDETEIRGVAANRSVIDANQADHVFEISDDATIRGVMLTGASTTAVYMSTAAAIDLYLDQVEIAGNGGGVSVTSHGDLTIYGSTIAENEGRGIYVAAGSTLILNSTISNNLETGNGAGIYVGYQSSAQEVILVNVTITENVAFKGQSSSLPDDKAGGIYVESDMDVFMYNTIAAYNFAGTAMINSDLGVEEATPHSGHIEGTNNLIGMVGNSNYYGGAIIIEDEDPYLDDLGYYGGTTRTQRPQINAGPMMNENSLAIDTGDDAVALAYELEEDQRGFSRFVDHPKSPPFIRPGPRNDIGAVELALSEM